MTGIADIDNRYRQCCY